MDAVVKPWPKPAPAEKPTLSDHIRAVPEPVVPKPSREEALAAVRTLIAYAGDNPDREGLRDTPKRVIDAYDELYSGYRECPVDVLERTFTEIGSYDDFVLVRDIAFNSHCEHHMMPFMGKAHIAYKPVDRVVVHRCRPVVVLAGPGTGAPAPGAGRGGEVVAPGPGQSLGIGVVERQRV